MRTLTTEQASATQADRADGMMLVQLDLAETLYLTNLPYSFNWNGQIWAGVGALGSVDPVQEQAELEATTVKLTLSGIPPELIETAITEHYQGKRAQIWFCPMTADGRMIGQPLRVFFGRIDTMDIEVGETATVTLSAESKLVDWGRVRGGRYNHEDQIARFPNDKGLEYVAAMVSVDLVWGRDG